MCAGALYWSKIGRIVYGTRDDKNGYKKFCKCPPEVEGISLAPWPFHPRTELVQGVMEDECALIMKDFFKAKR
jgi:tRNA(adenine34) deaminase